VEGGGVIYLGDSTGPTTITPNGHIDAPAIIANDASFDTCEVNGSPVLTQATAPVVPYPAAGVPVSTGSAWAASIPKADVVVTNPIAPTTISNTGYPLTVVGDTYLGGAAGTGVHFAPGGNITLPGAAGKNSTIDFGANYGNPAILLYDSGSGLTYGIGINSGEMQFFVGPPGSGSGKFTWTDGSTLTPTGSNQLAEINPSYFAFTGWTGSITIPSGVAGTLLTNSITNQGINNGAETDFINVSSTVPQRAFVWFNAQDGGTIDSTTSPLMTLGGFGDLTIKGTLYAAAKSFLIVNPANDTEYLNHGAVEGPEYAVFYRGEGVTASGFVKIFLPDYFEALTATEGRTVLVTAIMGDDDTEFAIMAASRVEGGMFRVRSSIPAQAFCWEVKAVRKDIPPLQVITDIPVKASPSVAASKPKAKR
jgi:hypothetical protein